MEFKTAAQKNCYERIKPWMQELFADFVVTYDELEPLFVINCGSAVAYTQVVPWDETEAIVVTRACVATNVEITLDLMYYLLRENNCLYFGSFALDGANDVIFEHSLIGSTCDREELKMSVTAVVKFADEYDDEIVSRWGGQRAQDQAWETP